MSRFKDRQYRSQAIILACLTVVFVLGTVFLVRKGQGRLLVSGLTLLAAVSYVSNRLGLRGIGDEMMTLTIVCLFVLYGPLALDAPITGASATCGLVGALTAQGIWAINRYPPTADRPQPVFERIRESLPMGLIVATGVSILVTLVLAVIALTRPGALDFVGAVWTLHVLGYFGGALVATIFIGLLLPLARWPLGAMATGVPAGVFFYVAMASILRLIDQSTGYVAWSPTQVGLAAIGVGLFVGPAAAVAFKWSEASEQWHQFRNTAA